MATWIAHLRAAENILNEEKMDMFVNRASANIMDMLSVDLRR